MYHWAVFVHTNTKTRDYFFFPATFFFGAAAFGFAFGVAFFFGAGVSSGVVAFVSASFTSACFSAAVCFSMNESTLSSLAFTASSCFLSEASSAPSCRTVGAV